MVGDKEFNVMCYRVSINSEILSPQAMIIAAAQGQTQLIKTHLQAGGHPDATITGKTTALGYAAMLNNADLAWPLIKAGALLDYQDGVGNTACTYAVLSGAADVLELLLSNGAQLDLCNQHGKRSTDYVGCNLKNIALVREIIRNYYQYNIALSQSVQSGQHH